MTEEEQHVVPIITATRTFEGHESKIFGVAVFPDRRRMVTASGDETLRLWDLEDGVVLKKMEGHRRAIRGLAVSRDGQCIASGDWGGELIAWNRDGESLTNPIKVHSKLIMSLDFSPDSTFLVQGNPIYCRYITCVQYSPSGEHLAIATLLDIQIWNPGTRVCVAKFKGHLTFGSLNQSLAWTPDGKQLVSGGEQSDPTIRIWDSSTWKQVGEPYKGHTAVIWMIAPNPTGTLLASASSDY